MVYSVNEIMNKALEGKQPVLVLETEESFKRALNLVEKAFEGRIAIVQGPPGTGKTTVFIEAIDRVIDRLDERELIIYVAPTNKLVAQTLDRVAHILSKRGYKTRDILSMVRVYGSQFDFTDYEKLNWGVDREVRIVLTTEYQRVSSRDHDTIHLLVDEASRSKLHRPFIASARDLTSKLERGEEIYGSINVVGDPMQAIVLGEKYWMSRRIREERLIIEAFTKNLLILEGFDVKDDPIELMKLAHKHLSGKYFELLRRTYRLPSPTEAPISEGYYDGLLEARYSAKDVLKGLWAGRTLPSGDKLLREVYNIVEKAITTGIPLIIVEPSKDRRGYEYFQSLMRTGAIYSPIRAKLSMAFAITLTLTTEKETYVIAPYRDQVQRTMLELRRSYSSLIGGLRDKIRFATVQKMLGSEADNIVAVLGKEYHGGEDEPTIYFKEPELFNVQLSRHKKVLVIIGDLMGLYKQASEADQKLRTKRYRGLLVTAKKLLELANLNPNSSPPTRKVIEGNGAIYWRYDA